MSGKGRLLIPLGEKNDSLSGFNCDDEIVELKGKG